MFLKEEIKDMKEGKRVLVRAKSSKLAFTSHVQGQFQLTVPIQVGAL